MPIITTFECLILDMLIVHFLKSTFKLYYIKNMVYSDTLKINNVIYNKEQNSKGNDGFIGFFDWLRIDKFTIVGVRICYFEHQPYNKLLMSFPYIRPAFDNKCMELLFEGNKYDPDISGDQDFTNNYVFKSGEEYLFTFGLDYLTDEELKSLLKHCIIIENENLA